MGQPLPDYVVPIAAANPYKFRRCPANSLTKGLKLDQLRSSELVYLVHPLPQSMLTSVWNFGSLDPADEFKYILKIIDELSRRYSQISMLQRAIAIAIKRSQDFMKKKQQIFSVSLRDIARFVKVLEYFLKQYPEIQQALALAFFFIYQCRLDQNSLRLEYVYQVFQYFPLLSKFNATVDTSLQQLAQNLDVDQGIALNKPLLQNVFLLIVSIDNCIPIIMTGPPGSSKTLSTRIVYKNMRGEHSKSPFFKNKSRLILKSYQCSELSTSEVIFSTFQRAKETQEKFPNHKIVVILDEIGLAQKSPFNPLKALHSLLQPAQVGVIGLSNWSLDAAKMNRAVHASRPPIQVEDLQQTGLSLRTAMKSKANRKLLKILADCFYQYLTNLENSGSFYFHGTRDFYNSIRQICNEWKKRRDQEGQVKKDWKTIVSHALSRNFGGKKEYLQDTLRFFETLELGMEQN